MLNKLNQAVPALALMIATLATMTNAHAHRAWMLPSATVIEDADPWVTIDAAISNDLFDINYHPLKLDALVITGPDGKPVAPLNALTGRLRSTFDIKLDLPGTYKASIVTHGVMASYKLNGEVKRWRGSEEEFATALPGAAQDVKVTRMSRRLETMVSSGKPNDTVFKTSGVGLEWVPLTHPNDMRAGEKATWRFLLDGKAASNQSFSLVPGGVRYRGVLGEIRHTTDANGDISFTLPDAGMYFLNTSWPQPQVATAAATAAAAPATAAATPPASTDQRPQPPTRRVSYAATVEVLPQ
jgi:uncharacterized GH25 family protein